MFASILVPVDLSDRGAETARQAGALAQRFSASITLLHVIETLDAPFEELRPFYEQLERTAGETLDRWAASLRRDGLTVDEQIVYGRRAREVIKFAEDRPFDLVVVGSHQLTPDNLGGGLLTISHQIAIACAVPVLILKPRLSRS
jgi:nucleotide-binding universal stress UspA family protein